MKVVIEGKEQDVKFDGGLITDELIEDFLVTAFEDNCSWMESATCNYDKVKTGERAFVIRYFENGDDGDLIEVMLTRQDVVDGIIRQAVLRLANDYDVVDAYNALQFAALDDLVFG